MDEKKKNNNPDRDESDGFWDIPSLLSRRGQAKSPPRKKRSTYTVDITFDPPDTKSDGAITPTVPEEIGRASCRERVFGYV